MAVKFSGGFKPPAGIKVTTGAPSEVILPGTGDSGRNIALLGSNGLVVGSYSASASYNSAPAGAFDGWNSSNEKVNQDQNTYARQGNGWWVTANGQPTDHWVAVNMGQLATVGALRMISKSSGLQYRPKDIDFQVSDDGIVWTTHESITWARNVDQTIKLTENATSQYFRIYVNSNQDNNGAYSIIEEMELLYPIENEYTYLIGSGSTGRNIALTGTNGLTGSSYTASSYYTHANSDVPEAAFDGYNWSAKINDDAGSKVARGTWLSGYPSTTNEWIQVDMGQQASVAAIRVYHNASYLSRLPSSIQFQTSNDGVAFTTHDTVNLTSTVDQTLDLATVATARYFRLFVPSNQGDSQFISMDEIELLQPVG